MRFVPDEKVSNTAKTPKTTVMMKRFKGGPSVKRIDTTILRIKFFQGGLILVIIVRNNIIH